MPDLHDLLAEEAERQSPQRIPSFDVLIGRARRRHHLRLGSVVAGVAVAVVAAIWGTSTAITGDGGKAVGPAKPSATSGPSSEVALLPTDHWRPGQGGRLALISGELIISRRDGTTCAWIGNRQTAVLWPEGYGIRLSDGALVNATGEVVAHPGDRVAAGGGSTEAVTAGPCNRKGQWTFSIESDVHRVGT